MAHRMYRPIFIFSFLVTILVLHCQTVHSYSGGRGEKTLVNKLMTEYGHKAARPVRDAARPVWVYFRFLPSQIIKFDETQQQLTIMAYMRMSWRDEFITWNPDDYDGIELLALRPSDLWLPDIALYQSCSKEFISYQETYVLCLYNGTCDWHFPAILTSTCKVDVRYFPFDIQLCDLTFGAWSADVTMVELHTFEVPDDTSDDIFAKNGVWTLESFTAINLRPFYVCCPHNFTEIKYTLRLRRESAFFTKVVVVPSVLLTMLMALTFWSHPDSGEKVTLAISNLLAMILFQQLVADSMPPIGDTTSVLVTFFFIMIALGCGAVVCAVIVLRIYHSGGERHMPTWLKFIIIKRLQRMRKRRHSLPEVVTAAEKQPRDTKSAYSTINVEGPNGKGPHMMRQTNSHSNSHSNSNSHGHNHGSGAQSRPQPWAAIAAARRYTTTRTASCTSPSSLTTSLR
eukprot:XP_003726263.2 PREDICTED: neuronal acetylcholine receptor subunit alpha-9-II [Strongylocentrotus purpuratus]